MTTDTTQGGKLEELNPVMQMLAEHMPQSPLALAAQKAKVFEALFDKPVVRRFGRYIVLDTLGQGGMGVVLKGYDDELQRAVAIKVLHPDLITHHGSRLKREAQAMAQLAHPNVVQVYEIGEVEGQLFVAMELVNGETLKQWQVLRRRPNDWKGCVAVYLQAGRGLAAAHSKGLVHRDFKPHNAILDNEGRVRVLDFGLARQNANVSDIPTSISAPFEQEGTRADLALSLTETGAVLGTPAYMSPEQMLGRKADARSDQFSFCVALYEALYSFRPFAGSSWQDLALSTLQGKIRSPPKGTRIPVKLHRILARGLSREPSSRWPSMNRLIVELERVLVQKRIWGNIATALLIVLALGSTPTTPSSVAEFPCSETASALDDIWNPTAQYGIREIFAHHGKGYAALEERTIRAFDDYAAAWIRMNTVSCRATHVEYTQPPAVFESRLQCLQRRQSRLQVAINLVSGSENTEQLMQRSAVPFSLLPVKDCDSLGYIASEHPPPSDEDGRTGELRNELDEATALFSAGDYQSGIDRAQQVVVDAESAGYKHVLVAGLEQLGRMQASVAGAADAERNLRRAIQAGSSIHLDQEVALSWVHLLFTLARQNRLEEALFLEPAVRAAVERVDNAHVWSWMLANLGVLHAERREHSESVKYFRRALATVEKVGMSDFVLGVSWYNFGTALADSGDLENARRALGRSRKLFEDTVDTGHPMTSLAFGGQCRVARMQERNWQAVALCNDALAYFDKVPTPSLWIAYTSFELAKSQWALGIEDEAYRNAERARSSIREEGYVQAQFIEDWIREKFGAEEKGQDGSSLASVAELTGLYIPASM